MLERIQETAAYLKGKMHTHPETAIILGTGLGSLAEEITEKYEIKYEEIPNFPVSTVEGHSGKLIFGKLGNKDIMAMQGRFHYYEGYSMKEVTFPVRVMRELGIKTLFVSNASGGTNPAFEIGDLMIITDHINYFPEHPLRGKNIPYGPRFPDMSEAYDKELIRKADAIAAQKGTKVQLPKPRNQASRCSTVSTWEPKAPLSRLRQNINCSIFWEPMLSACLPYPKSSLPIIAASKYSAYPSSPTWA
mgnify:CR=1 FL=1